MCKRRDSFSSCLPSSPTSSFSMSLTGGSFQLVWLKIDLAHLFHSSISWPSWPSLSPRGRRHRSPFLLCPLWSRGPSLSVVKISDRLRVGVSTWVCIFDVVFALVFLPVFSYCFLISITYEKKKTGGGTTELISLSF